MVVKDKVGRKRYIAFLVETGAGLKRHEMIRAINGSLPPGLTKDDVRLTAFNGEVGIVLCPHKTKDEVCKALNSITSANNREIRIRTVATSGTIKKAKARLGKMVKQPL